MSSSIANAKQFLQAKQFLVDRIAEEAAREGAPLDEVETSMLAFSEADASARQMETAQTFEEQSNSEEYESRIARLARSAYDRDEAAGRKPEWDQALD